MFEDRRWMYHPDVGRHRELNAVLCAKSGCVESPHQDEDNEDHAE